MLLFTQQKTKLTNIFILTVLPYWSCYPLLLGLHSQGNASGLAHWEQQGPHQSPTGAYWGKDASFTGTQRSQEQPFPSITLK